MSTIELEAQKACLAREVLSIDDENVILNIELLLKKYARQDKPLKRQLGVLDGKARIVFKDDFEMTTEELLGLQ